MVKRFIIYGLTGWILEIAFTGTTSILSGSPRLLGYTYLWMFPIYGMAILLEPIHDRIRFSPWMIRGFIWAGIIFTIEYLSGWILQAAIGVCPWDYTNRTPYSIDGFIRLDFLPAWFLAGLLFERLHDYLITVQARIK
jgi:uncharacterized membrane protein